MYGIERANRLDRERSSRSHEHGIGDGEDAAATLEIPQPSEYRALF
jgi:hypothetical protein